MSDISPRRPSQSHSRRALDLPLELLWRGVSHPIRTALVHEQGALAISPVSCPPWAHVQVRNPRTGAEAPCRVEWCRGDASQTGPRYRLAFRILDDTRDLWGGAQDP